jgi:hypothetical protein
MQRALLRPDIDNGAREIALNPEILSLLLQKWLLGQESKRKLLSKELTPDKHAVMKYLPTIGAELQANRVSIAPQVSLPSGVFLLRSKQDYANLASVLGFFASDDDYYEFALSPSRTSEVQALQTKYLAEIGLIMIPSNGNILSAQMNLGTVRTRERYDNTISGDYSEVNYLQLMLAFADLAHDNVDFENVRKSSWYTAGMTSWRSHQSTIAGQSENIVAEATEEASISELRLIDFLSELKMYKTFFIVQKFGAAIKAVQKVGQRDEVEIQLAAIWDEFRSHTTEILKSIEIELPEVLTPDEFSILFEELMLHGSYTAGRRYNISKTESEFRENNHHIAKIDEEEIGFTLPLAQYDLPLAIYLEIIHTYSKIKEVLPR